MESSEVSPEPPLPQTKQSQLPQPLRVRLGPQIPHSFIVDTLQVFNVFLVLRGNTEEYTQTFRN